jgi:hypothetical protein
MHHQMEGQRQPGEPPFDPACVHLTQSRLQVDEQNITKKEGDLTHGWEWDHGRDEHAG